MKEVLKAISDYLMERKMNHADVAKKCGWPESKLVSILNGYQKLNAADYGILCEALHVPYDSFYKRSKGIHSAI